MTAEILDEGVDDAQEVIIAWLQPLRRTAGIRRLGDPLPFTLVEHITGEEVDGYSDEVVSVHTLCDRALGEDAAKEETERTHRRMMLLARYLEDVELIDGRTATIDYVNVFQSPIWVEYGDAQILRKVGRYKIGLSYTNVVAGS